MADTSNILPPPHFFFLGHLYRVTIPCPHTSRSTYHIVLYKLPKYLFSSLFVVVGYEKQTHLAVGNFERVTISSLVTDKYQIWKFKNQLRLRCLHCQSTRFTYLSPRLDTPQKAVVLLGKPFWWGVHLKSCWMLVSKSRWIRRLSVSGMKGVMWRDICPCRAIN